jgi:hypothetical protein
VEKKNSEGSKAKSAAEKAAKQPRIIVLAAHYDSKVFPEVSRFLALLTVIAKQVCWLH